MDRNILLVGLLSFVMFFCACSSRSVQSTMKAEPDLRGYKTYAWLPAGDTLLNDFNNDPELVMSVMDRVNNGMANRGYKMDTNNPDLLILVHTKNNDAVKQNTLPSAYTYYQQSFDEGPWFSNYYSEYKTVEKVTGPQVRDVEYTEGTLVIDFIDADNKEIVWRGNATNPTKKKSDIKETVDNVDEILAEFPC